MTGGMKAVKEPPARSVISYPEAVYAMRHRWKDGTPTDCAGIYTTLATIYERDEETVIADLNRGHV